MKILNKTGAFVLLALPVMSVSCTIEELIIYAGCELGAAVKQYEVSIEAGQVDVEVYSNSLYNINEINGATWLEFPSSVEGSGGFRVKYEENTEFPRMATLRLSIESENQYDTIYIKQAGVKVPELKLIDAGVSVPGSSQAVMQSNPVKVAFETNIPVDDIEWTLVYTSGSEEWIHDVVLSDDNYIEFRVDENPDSENVRKATITLSFVDGWDNEVSQVCYITQATSEDEIGEEQSFEQVRGLATTDGFAIENNIIIEGYVVSDTDSGNMGDNEQMTTSYIDYNVCRKTVYLESIDGSYGFMLQTYSIDDNVFNRYDYVKLCLSGAVIYREDDPERYRITNVSSSMILSQQSGTASDIPDKSMHICDLTDADIYTYVRLLDCELPVRKGPMTPINEGYTIAGGANRYQKFALLLRDINGDDMYIYTNTTCPYRRTGERLPYGSGTMSGVIVHEKYTRYEYADNDSGDEDTYGYIGRYQIRHVSYDDFGMADDFSDSFSALLTEYRYITDERPNQVPPTYGSNGYMEHTYRYNNGTGTTAILKSIDYSYLGPIGTGADEVFGTHYGNENGLGIILEDGTDWMADDETINNDDEHKGKGQVPATVGSAWHVWYNWNTSEDVPYAWVINFSTLGISTTCLSMQVSMLNQVNSENYGPRYWVAEWSLTGNTGTSYDHEWTEIASFTIPDTANWTPATQLWQNAGYKPMNFTLPLDMLGYANVYIRLRPKNRLGGTYLEYAVENTDSSSTMPWTAMNYFAIRYNK